MERYIEFVTNHPMLMLGLVVILSMILWTELRRFTRGYKEISPMEAVQLINHEDALVLDVREDAELGQGRIRGAKHIPMSMLGKRLEELNRYRDRPVVTYCRSGARSAQASNLLKKHQFQKVFNIAGGLLAWENANLPKSKK
jgi:rhodanese-related sulfurtransferase